MLTKDLVPKYAAVTEEARKRFEAQVKLATEAERYDDLVALNNMVALGPKYDLTRCVPEQQSVITVGLNKMLLKHLTQRNRAPEGTRDKEILTSMLAKAGTSPLGQVDVVYVPQELFGHRMYLTIEQVLACGEAFGLSPFNRDMPAVHVLYEQPGSALCAHAPIQVGEEQYLFEILGHNMMGANKRYELKPSRCAQDKKHNPQTIWIFSRERVW